MLKKATWDLLKAMTWDILDRASQSDLIARELVGFQGFQLWRFHDYVCVNSI